MAPVLEALRRSRPVWAGAERLSGVPGSSPKRFQRSLNWGMRSLFFEAYAVIAT